MRSLAKFKGKANFMREIRSAARTPASRSGHEGSSPSSPAKCESADLFDVLERLARRHDAGLVQPGRTTGFQPVDTGSNPVPRTSSELGMCSTLDYSHLGPHRLVPHGAEKQVPCFQWNGIGRYLSV